MKSRILVVDDEARMRRFVRMNLDLEGYEVFEAENGLIALQRVRDDMPDLVLLDVMSAWPLWVGSVAGLEPTPFCIFTE